MSPTTFPVGILASSVLKITGSFESIATITLSSGNQSSIEFTSIPQTYQHLQIRGILGYSVPANMLMSFNNNAFSISSSRLVYSTGSSTLSDYYSDIGILSFNGGTAGNDWCAGTWDILNYSDTLRRKNVRAVSGVPVNTVEGIIGFFSGYSSSTSAINSIKLTLQVGGANFLNGTTVALYGIKGQ